MLPDESLFQRLKASEPTSYEWLVDRFEGPLFRFFFSEHRDYHLAEEQTSETFAQIVRSLPMMKGNHEQLPAFVFSIARHLKSRRWRQKALPSVPLDAAGDLQDSGPIPEAVAAKREQSRRMFDALSQFEPEVREVLLLRYVEDASLNDIANIVGIPLGTVKSHIHRGIARLKTLFAETETQS